MKIGDLVKFKVRAAGRGRGGIPADALGIVVDLDGGNETWVTVTWGWKWDGKICKNFLRDLEVVSES